MQALRIFGALIVVVVARIGEEFHWAGPIGIADSAPLVPELRAACGSAPVEHVGMLISRMEFERRYPHSGTPLEPPPPPRSN